MGVMMRMSRTYLSGNSFPGDPGGAVAVPGARLVAAAIRTAGICMLGLIGLAVMGSAERTCTAAESGNVRNDTAPGIRMPSLHASSPDLSGGIGDLRNAYAHLKEPATRSDSRESRGLYLRAEKKPSSPRRVVWSASAKDSAASTPPDRPPQPAPRGLTNLSERRPSQYGYVPVDGVAASLLSPGTAGTPPAAAREQTSGHGYVPVNGVAASLLNPGNTGTQPSMAAGEQTSGYGYVSVSGVAASLISPARPTARESVAANRAQERAPSGPMVWNGLSAKNRAAQKAIDELAEQKPPQWPGQPPVVATATATATTPPVPAGQTIESVIEQLNAQRALALTERRPPSQRDTVTANGASPAGPQKFSLQEPPTLEARLMSATPGLTLWTEASPANLAAQVAVSGPRNPAPAPVVAKVAPRADGPWSLGEDLDKYRAHAVREGSRDSGESLKKALERAGLALEDGANIFVLGYGSDRAKPFRVNDGKGLLDDPGKVPQQAGATLGTLGAGLYSVADLVTLNALPDPNGDDYRGNHPLVRPLIYTGQTIGGVWKTTEEVGNAVTWGYFDNVTGCIGLCLESILELLKHTGEAVTNLARAPVHLIAGKDNEGANRAMDWVLVVPLEFISNSFQMKGIVNMQEYQTAFADKGVIGSVLEFGGSTFIIYRAVDEILDELDDDHHSRHANSEGNGEPTTPEPEVPTPEPTIPTDIELLWDGDWPVGYDPTWQGNL